MASQESLLGGTLTRTDTTLDHSQKAEKVCGAVPAEQHVTFVTVSPSVEMRTWSQYDWNRFLVVDVSMTEKQQYLVHSPATK